MLQNEKLKKINIQINKFIVLPSLLNAKVKKSH